MKLRATTAIAVLVSLLALASVACEATGPTPAVAATPSATATATPSATATATPAATTTPASVSATPAATTPVTTTPAAPAPATPVADATAPADGDTVVVAAPVESVMLVILEMDPPRYMLRIVSGLPSGCARFNGYESAIDGNTITVTVTNLMPAGDAICTAIYGLYEGEVVLGRDFTSRETYTVTVNGELAETFTAQ